MNTYYMICNLKDNTYYDGYNDACIAEWEYDPQKVSDFYLFEIEEEAYKCIDDVYKDDAFESGVVLEVKKVIIIG